MITPLELKFEGKATSAQEVTLVRYVGIEWTNGQTDKWTDEQGNEWGSYIFNQTLIYELHYWHR